MNDFRPSTHGLRFANYWPSGTPALSLDTPLGRISIGDAGNGLCGGFCFTVLDLQQAGLQPPTDMTPPPAGSPLVNYLTWRLIASWNIPSGILKYYSWASAPDSDILFGFPGVWRMTIEKELPKITRILDSGQPCTLGLVTVHSRDPADLAYCHQVLAYRYRRDGSRLVLAVYDPNTPNGDDVIISIETVEPAHPGAIDSNVNIPRAIRGFFAVTYSFHDPSPVAGPSWLERDDGPAVDAEAQNPNRTDPR